MQRRSRAESRRTVALAACLCGALFAAACGGAKANDPAAVAPLLGPWRMESYRDGDQMKPLLPGSDVTCEFGTDLVSGSTGVNDYSDSYRVSGDGLRFDVQPPGDEEGPPDLAAQERAFLDDLDAVRCFAVRDGRLTLMAKDGGVLLTMLPGTEADVVGAWICTGYDTGSDLLVKPAATKSFTLDLGEGGSVSGGTPAGTYLGGYETTGAAGMRIADIELLPAGGALPRDRIAGRVFLAALGETAGYQLGDGTLSLKDGSGYVVATFVSAESE